MIPFGKDKEMRYLMSKEEELKENVIRSGNNTITLYDANGKRIDSKTGSGEYKFALAEYDVSTNYVYFEFSGTIGCPIGNALGTPSVVSYSMR